ncbi:sulfotransferase family protein [Chondrinema litorale]|uniref:sulfotransferase-like domain-containing protein n=1 Tax=Chondrinema litorale TaxID=2994555 RepID=UPI00254341C6|nr:sulfotransferase family protein [Chondrinema litorale]UZR92925.1 sulfotransferase family protein [Chondrinema litorale]
METKRICMWSGPRNVSTAFMYSFAQREDTQVVDEPFYAHYLKITGVDHPGREEILESMENGALKVIEDLIFTPKQKPVYFIKNMAHHFLEIPDEFLFRLDNMFLIRNPNEMLPSLIKNIPNPVMLDTAYELQYHILNKLLEKGIEPIVVDSKELLLQPEIILTKLCEKLKIPFDKNMLSWEAGPREEDGIWEKYWYHSVHKSTGFAAYKQKEEEVPTHLEGLLTECSNLYEKMYEYALKA